MTAPAATIAPVASARPPAGRLVVTHLPPPATSLYAPGVTTKQSSLITDNVLRAHVTALEQIVAGNLAILRDGHIDQQPLSQRDTALVLTSLRQAADEIRWSLGEEPVPF